MIIFRSDFLTYLTTHDIISLELPKRWRSLPHAEGDGLCISYERSLDERGWCYVHNLEWAIPVCNGYGNDFIVWL